jgi:mono/diheme cytochrome c family protein
MRILRWTGLTLLGLALAAVAAVILVQARWTRRFEAPYPAIAGSADPGMVSRGEYLVYGAAACAYCHVPREEWGRLDRGERLPLTGHHLFRLPFGDIYSANLTPHADTGIGRRSDADLARILRYGVRADGRAAFPLMEFQLSDDDLTAVVSYLRAQRPISHAVPEHQLSLVGKTLMAFAIKPAVPLRPAPKRSPSGPTVERGAYLANSVSSCAACHTNRGPDGALTGAPFGGGQRMDVAADPTKVFVSPNLTPDPRSPVGAWTEETFLRRFRAGEVFPGSPMPWGAFARFTDDDLRAIYRYLRSLPATPNQTGAAVQAK